MYPARKHYLFLAGFLIFASLTLNAESISSQQKLVFLKNLKHLKEGLPPINDSEQWSKDLSLAQLQTYKIQKLFDGPKLAPVSCEHIQKSIPQSTNFIFSEFAKIHTGLEPGEELISRARIEVLRTQLAATLGFFNTGSEKEQHFFDDTGEKCNFQNRTQIVSYLNSYMRTIESLLANKYGIRGLKTALEFSSDFSQHALAVAENDVRVESPKVLAKGIVGTVLISIGFKYLALELAKYSVLGFPASRLLFLAGLPAIQAGSQIGGNLTESAFSKRLQSLTADQLAPILDSMDYISTAEDIDLGFLSEQLLAFEKVMAQTLRKELSKYSEHLGVIRSQWGNLNQGIQNLDDQISKQK